MIRVLVAAPYPLTRAGLAALVDADSASETVGTIGEVEAIVPMVEALAPDVVLLDGGDEPDRWLEEIWRLADAQVLPPVLLLTGAPGAAVDALHQGVSGTLLRDASPEEIGDAIRAVARGLVALDRRVAAALIAADEVRPHRVPEIVEPVEALTSREREVLQLIAQGFPNKAIAAELGISEHTVKFHVGSIFDKLGASSRAEALARAARLGLIIL